MESTVSTSPKPSLRSWIRLPNFSSARSDLPAGLVVFLVALPLCLGVALASGAPLISGIIAGVIGGIVVALFSGSELSVSGPAAGLAVIVLKSIEELKSFPAFALAVLLSGAFQLGMGLLRAGVIGDFIPNMVIKGMLAGIGIVIILKQIPHALGDDNDFVGDEGFNQPDHLNTFNEVTQSVGSINYGAIVISLISLVILFGWDHPAVRRRRWISVVPAPLLCVVFGTLMNEAFKVLAPSWVLSAAKHHLVELPVLGSIHEVLNTLQFPDFSRISDPLVWKVALTVAIVGSLESLLSLEASDKLDTEKRISDPNAELRAQGLGNLTSGLLGGLPVTSVIVRSSANIYSGAKTRLSSIIHGILLLVAVLLIPTLLNRVPLACLASILLSVGYKLSSWKIIRSVWKEGWSQFLPFAITVAGIVFTDLLKGILIGLCVSVFFVMRAYTRTALTMVKDGEDILIRLNKDLTFVNKQELKARLREVPDGARLVIDGVRAHYVDHDAAEVIREFCEGASHRGIQTQCRRVQGITHT
jgi:MFS superfamily sulfate permease-like transporter